MLIMSMRYETIAYKLSLLYILCKYIQCLQVVDDGFGASNLHFTSLLGDHSVIHVIHSFFFGEFHLHFTKEINYPQVTGNSSL